MLSLIVQISSFLPIFLASPTMYAGILLIMSSTNHTRLRVFAAWVGSAAAVVVIGFIAVSTGGALTVKMQPTTLSGVIDILLGAGLILLLIWVLFRRKPRPEDQKKAKPPEDPAAGPKFFKYSFYGILLVVTNPTSLASFFASAKLTIDSGLETTLRAAAMLIAGLYFTLPVLIPLFLLLFAPALSRKFLAFAQRVLSRYGRVIMALFLLYVGIEFIVKGVKILG